MPRRNDPERLSQASVVGCASRTVAMLGDLTDDERSALATAAPDLWAALVELERTHGALAARWAETMIR